MFSLFRKNITYLICLTFLFRLLFVSTGAFASADTPVSRTIAEQCSHDLIIKHHTSFTLRNENNDYVDIEVCEEDSDVEDGLEKTMSPALVLFFHSVFKNALTPTGSDNPFDSIKCSLYPKKYLAISVLRV